MKRLFGIIAFLSFALVVCTPNSLAGSFDYADATGYFNSDVYSENATWNRLGTGWTGESSAADVADNTDSDDGVLWSINGGAFGNGEISIGDIVKFSFTLSKVEWGRHSEDYLKVWIDWNRDKDFSDTGEMVFASSYASTPVTDPDGSPSQFLNAGHTPVVVATFNYETTFIESGDYWLRARVVCNADVINGIANMSPTAHYYQGEIEDWLLTIGPQKTPPLSTPEPTTILLLGLGLTGVAAARKFRR